MNDDISRHYGRGGLLDRIEKGLIASGIDPAKPSVDELEPVDEFHSRGREATLEIVEMIDPTSEDRILDVGCGLGGTARFLAHNYGCRVHGIDLTDEYVDVAGRLNSLVGLDDRVTIEKGSALELPFEDDAFDYACTQHVQMNIGDKKTFYREIARVLKPGGELVFNDIFCGDESGPISFPVPWAEDSSMSHLVPSPEARSLIEDAGLEIAEWHDRREESIGFFAPRLEKAATNGPPPLGLHLLLGDNAGVKLANYLDNLRSERVTVVLGRAVKVG